MKQIKSSLKTFVFIAAFALAGAPTAPLGNIVPTVHGEAHAYFIIGVFGYTGGNCTGDREYSRNLSDIWKFKSYRLHTSAGFGPCQNL